MRSRGATSPRGLIEGANREEGKRHWKFILSRSVGNVNS